MMISYYITKFQDDLASKQSRLLKSLLVLGLPTIALIVLLLGSPRSSHAQNPVSDPQLRQSVVKVFNIQNSLVDSTGSGTIVSPTGLIYTNFHVIEDAEDVVIAILEDVGDPPVRRYRATVQSSFQDLDFAVLQIDRTFSGQAVLPTSLNLPFIDLEGVVDPEFGDRVSLLGYPGISEGRIAVTEGIITSVTNGEICEENVPFLYLTDAEIAPGNSGGLAFTADGDPVGIPTFVDRDSGARLGGIIPFSAISHRFDCPVALQPSPTPTSPAPEESTPDPYPDVRVVCDDGLVVEGPEISIQGLRTGTYRVTAIGFSSSEDPVLAVGNVDSRGNFFNIQCNDNHSNAASYALETITGNSNSAQIVFSQSTNLGLKSIVLGGYNGSGGDFLLFIEGMAITGSDQQFGGDWFSIYVTQSVDVNSLIEVLVASHDTHLDTLLMAVEESFEYVLEDPDGNLIYCDDIVSDCWKGDFGNLIDLRWTGYSGTHQIHNTDAALGLFSDEFGYGSFNFITSSYNLESFGSYTLIIAISLK